MASNKKHGFSKITEYNSWNNFRTRCNNPNHRYYKNYGGRGITYDPRWEVFEVFFTDMGRKPSPDHTLDRIDNSGNYCKENCRWSNRCEQANNTRNNKLLSYEGKTMTYSNWERFLGLKHGVISDRIRLHGWSVHDTLTKPSRVKNKK